MPGFAYSAITADGLVSDGEIHAPSLDAAREQLRVRGLLPERLTEMPASGQSGAGTAFKKVKPKSLQIFSRQFATMIAAGLSVVAALVILEEQTDDKYLAEVIKEIRGDVEGGLLLSQAMERHPKVFNRLFVSMVEAGEAAGILDSVLDRVAFQIERDAAIKRRVKSAMMYPMMVLSFAGLVLTGMLFFLVPFFTKMYAQIQQGAQLPTLTQYIVKASDLLKHDWFIIFPLMIGGFFAFKRWKRTESGRRKWDMLTLHMPMKIGDVVLKVAMARFSRTLSTLIASGVDIIKALEITGQTAGNAIVEDALTEVRARVHEGVPIATPLVENSTFPPMVSQMVKVGEETGELDGMLGKIADFYEDEVDASIAAITSIIEPIMMIGVGMMVGIIVISMYLPIFKMLSLIGNQ
jgi:type IV pilus assembly protein PilC